MPKLPMLMTGPAGCGQDDLVRALSELFDVAYASRNATEMSRPSVDVPEAVAEAARTGARHVMLKLDGVDRLDAAAASQLAHALRTESILTRDQSPTGRNGSHGLMMLAEHLERVPDDLRRVVKVVPVDIPGSAYSAHVTELIGTAIAIERGLAGAWKLRLSETTWADLRDRVAAGANLNEIRAEIAQALADASG